MVPQKTVRSRRGRGRGGRFQKPIRKMRNPRSYFFSFFGKKTPAEISSSFSEASTARGPPPGWFSVVPWWFCVVAPGFLLVLAGIALGWFFAGSVWYCDVSVLFLCWFWVVLGWFLACSDLLLLIINIII